MLCGYGYAHWLSHARRQWVHGVLLVAAVALCRIVPAAALKPVAGADPVLRILLLLAVTVGLPYFALAATSPLLQSWYARQHRGVPYRFFALSNLASMLALLSYPLVIEPVFTLHAQASAWSAAFVIAACLNFVLYRTVPGRAPKPADSSRLRRLRPRGCGRSGWHFPPAPPRCCWR